MDERIALVRDAFDSDPARVQPALHKHEVAKARKNLKVACWAKVIQAAGAYADGAAQLRTSPSAVESAHAAPAPSSIARSAAQAAKPQANPITSRSARPLFQRLSE